MEVNHSASVPINWTLSEDLSGPAIAVFVGLEFVFSFSINLFIVTHTLHSLTNRRRRARNQKRSSSYFSSTVFLLNIAVANLLMTVLFMLPYVIAAAAGGWIYGSTDSQREATCITAAFVFSYTVSLSLTTLAAISFDRFLFIVKSESHRKWMKPKSVLATVVIIWVFSFVITLPIFFGNMSGNAKFAYRDRAGTCFPTSIGKEPYSIFHSVAILLPTSLIAITTIWTFVFTKKFLRRDYERRKIWAENLKAEKSVYTMRLRNLTGVFGSLLLSHVLTLTPFYVTSTIAFAIGNDRIPAVLYAACPIVFLLSNISNSLLQLYFRRDSLMFCPCGVGNKKDLEFNTHAQSSKNSMLSS